MTCGSATPKAISCASQNSEVLSLTYGSIVRQLITDLEDMDEVNKQLDIMWVSDTRCSQMAHCEPCREL